MHVTAGTGLDPVELPRKPRVADEPAPRVPFHDAFFAVTVVPEVVRVEPHDWLID